MTSVLSQRPKDCLACRVVSGGGLIGAGIYVAVQSKKSNNASFKLIMNIFALSAAGLGTARLLHLPPFNNKNQ